jgi:opacity protein-like surface antigen
MTAGIHLRGNAMKKLLLTAALFAAGLCAAAPASAGVLYSDGAINGTVSGWTINYGFAVADTFTLSGNSNLTGVQGIGLWLYPGDAPTGLDWEILTSSGGNLGTMVASGAASLSSSFLGTNGYGYSLYSAAFSLSNIHLASGTYWIAFANATSTAGDPVYWDINGGPSRAWESALGYDPNGGVCNFSECSDSFQIAGSAAVPEPGTLALLGAGLAGLGSWRARRKAKKAA